MTTMHRHLATTAALLGFSGVGEGCEDEQQHVQRIARLCATMGSMFLLILTIACSQRLTGTPPTPDDTATAGSETGNGSGEGSDTSDEDDADGDTSDSEETGDDEETGDGETGDELDNGRDTDSGDESSDDTG